MNSPAEPRGSIDTAIQHALKLLGPQPALAAEQAAEILKAVPGHPLALLILGMARRATGEADLALGLLKDLATRHPKWALAHYEYANTLSLLGRGEEAIAALRHAVAVQPDHTDAWRALGDHLTAIGDTAGADAAYARHIEAATRDPQLLAAARALVANQIPEAEARLRTHLKAHPTDVAALRMLAEVAARLRRWNDAEAILANCLELAPGFDAARHNYALVLNRQGRAPEALPHVEQLLAKEPRNPGYRALRAALLANVGEYEAARRVYVEILDEYPQQAQLWTSYGHTLKTIGDIAGSIAAYRRSLQIDPRNGEACWDLANLKTFRFEAADIEAMTAALERADLSDEQRLHFEFALGKALEDAARYEDSFRHYARGNALRLKLVPYRADENAGFIADAKALYTPEFFAARAGWGVPDRDPIFIVGLPRAGSTLLEQILSSHSQVEGTMELPNLPRLARSISRSGEESDRNYHATLPQLGPDEIRAYARRYLDETRVVRRTGRPLFLDKLPNNFFYVGLIHLLFPNARVIDARRHPLACGFSCFKQHFARGQSFAYSLDDLGRYYRDYVGLMQHYDRVLPGRVHRVIYEQIVASLEAEVRRLLEYCGLPFEEQCLRFYENERAVRTPSAEQVRRPIYREGLDQWRHYEPWLGPLEQALGPVLESYPKVPPGI